MKNSWNKIEEKRKNERRELIMNTPFEELSFEKLRERVIYEQNSCCNHCGIDEWRGSELSFEIDHIDGNNQNNSRENLEALCPNCHSQTGTWRGRNCKKKQYVSDQELFNALIDHDWNMRQSLLYCGLAAKGGNYKRCHRLKRDFELTGGVVIQIGSFKQKPSKEELIEMLKNQSMTQISERTNWSKSTVSRWVKSYGIVIERNSTKPSKEKLSELIESNSWTSIGRMFGVSDNAVRKWAKKYGII